MPRYFVDGRQMEMVRLIDMADHDALPFTKWNIRQPADEDIREEALSGTSKGLDLIVVPGLAFAADGRRLGSCTSLSDLMACLVITVS